MYLKHVHINITFSVSIGEIFNGLFSKWKEGFWVDKNERFVIKCIELTESRTHFGNGLIALKQ